MDVQAFKNIRNFLFAQITEELHKHKEQANASIDSSKEPSAADKEAIVRNKLYLYLFHLFESVVNNVAQLIQKTKYTILSQCGEAVDQEAKEKDPSKKKNTISDTINTIATGSELVTADKEGNKGGFFAENAKVIAKSSKSIEKAIEKISNQLHVINLNGNEARKMQEGVQKFIDQLPPL